MLTSKLTTNVTETPKKKFPLLAKATNGAYVVLFNNKSTGTIVHTDGAYYQLGAFSSDWIDCDEEGTWNILPKNTEITLKVE